MAQIPTVNIKSEDGYTTINKSDFNPTRDELFLKENEILVKPLNVENADPFVIDEKDFDGKSYERVNATKPHLDVVANQTPRATLAESLEKKSFVENNEYTAEFAKNHPAENKTVNEAVKQTPQTQLKRNQSKK